MMERLKTTALILAVVVVGTVALLVVMARGMVLDTTDRLFAEGPETTGVVAR